MQRMQQEKKTHAIEHFSKGCTWEEVATACGVNRTTLWRWSQSDPTFAQAIKEAGADADTEVEAVTFSNAIDPDPAHNTLRMFWLNSRKGYKQRSDVTSDDKAVHSPVVILPVKEMHADVQTPTRPTDGVPGE
jgi:hypothetical protein